MKGAQLGMCINNAVQIACTNAAIRSKMVAKEDVLEVFVWMKNLVEMLEKNN